MNELTTKLARVAEHRGPGPIASDRPGADEVPLPEALWRTRWSLLPEELERYRALGRDAAAAMTDVLTVDPRWPTRKVEGLPRPDLLVR
jgi:hypothetical protein